MLGFSAVMLSSMMASSMRGSARTRYSALAVSGGADLWIVLSIACKVTCPHFAFERSNDRLVQMSVGLFGGCCSGVKQDEIILIALAEIEWHVPS
jgi:hypothetical protein